jgi:hypothetical protein
VWNSPRVPLGGLGAFSREQYHNERARRTGDLARFARAFAGIRRPKECVAVLADRNEGFESLFLTGFAQRPALDA